MIPRGASVEEALTSKVEEIVGLGPTYGSVVSLDVVLVSNEDVGTVSTLEVELTGIVVDVDDDASCAVITRIRETRSVRKCFM